MLAGLKNTGWRGILIIQSVKADSMVHHWTIGFFNVVDPSQIVGDNYIYDSMTLYLPQTPDLPMSRWNFSTLFTLLLISLIFVSSENSDQELTVVLELLTNIINYGVSI